jgi:hypothetical protein
MVILGLYGLVGREMAVGRLLHRAYLQWFALGFWAYTSRYTDACILVTLPCACGDMATCMWIHCHAHMDSWHINTQPYAQWHMTSRVCLSCLSIFIGNTCTLIANILANSPPVAKIIE